MKFISVKSMQDKSFGLSTTPGGKSCIIHESEFASLVLFETRFAAAC